jgi:hypothetical protein
MIIKRLHTNSKIFFPNPYMVRVEFPETAIEVAHAEYRKIIRSAYKLLQGTWGYCPLELETWQTGVEHDRPANPNFNPLAGLPPSQILASLFETNYVSALRGYVCFAEEMDALQFRLTISSKARQVLMWPKKEFTIHEVVETDES